MSRIKALSAAAAAAVCALALAAAPSPPRVPTDEESLLSRLHALDEQEMQLGRLAQHRGSSRLVRRLGARLELDHDEADARLLRRAQSRGVTIEERGADEDDRQRTARLLSLEGAEFDRAFTETVAQDQARGAALMRAERSLTPDRATRRDMEKLLPLFDEHRQLAAFARERQ